MDKGYTTLFNSMEKALVHIQAAMIVLQQAQLDAEEIYMQTPSPEYETNPTEE